jgi:hypothetical protein
MPGQCDQAWLDGMTILLVASSSSYEIPPIIGEKPQKVPKLHCIEALGVTLAERDQIIA